MLSSVPFTFTHASAQERPAQKCPAQERPTQERPAQERPTQECPVQERPVGLRTGQSPASLFCALFATLKTAGFSRCA